MSRSVAYWQTWFRLCPSASPSSRHFSSHLITSATAERECCYIHVTPRKKVGPRWRKQELRARSSRKYKCLLTWRASDTTLTSVTGTFQPFVCFSRICCSCAALTTWLVCSRIAAVAPPCSYTRLHAPVVHHTTQPKNNFLLAANWIRQVSRRREAQERPDLLTYFSGLSFLWALQGPLSNPPVSSITGHVWTANCDYSGRPGVCQLQGGVSLWGWLDRHLQ